MHYRSLLENRHQHMVVVHRGLRRALLGDEALADLLDMPVAEVSIPGRRSGFGLEEEVSFTLVVERIDFRAKISFGREWDRTDGMNPCHNGVDAIAGALDLPNRLAAGGIEDPMNAIVARAFEDIHALQIGHSVWPAIIGLACRDIDRPARLARERDRSLRDKGSRWCPVRFRDRVPRREALVVILVVLHPGHA